jgi:hypothetical protein
MCVVDRKYPDAALLKTLDLKSTPTAQWTLGRCRGCAEGVVSPDFAMVYVTDFRASAWARWGLEDEGKGKVALKSDLPGYYLTQCRNCIPSANYPDSVAVMAVVPTSPAAQWTLVDLNNGKFAIRGNNQKYLARCLDCSPSRRTGTNSAFV